MTGATTTYVAYDLPGTFEAEHDSRPVASRDPRVAADTAPAGAFAFTFYDVVTTEVDGVELRSRPRNHSSRYFIGGTVRTVAEVEAMEGDRSILLSNMRGNGWDRVIFCPAGNVQPLESGDVVVTPGGIS